MPVPMPRPCFSHHRWLMRLPEDIVHLLAASILFRVLFGIIMTIVGCASRAGSF